MSGKVLDFPMTPEREIRLLRRQIDHNMRLMADPRIMIPLEPRAKWPEIGDYDYELTVERFQAEQEFYQRMTEQPAQAPSLSPGDVRNSR